MKNNIIFFICILSLSSILLSCSGYADSIPPRHYRLEIRFEDGAGNDKLRGIDYIEENEAHKIKRNIYRLEVAQIGKFKEELSLFPLYLQMTDSYHYLVFATSTPPESPDFHPSRLTHTFICPYIFGDSDEHIIISNWNNNQLCTSIIIDGKTYSANGTDQQGNAPFIVLLDK
ncbi:hypothetical protein [Dysgonomonas sp. ZJ279]|uniref:hypothetical protein n=1 Tax=Dysgonomonas sp. ZJ279 TaxID=2709796 RepID=UPI0013EC0304|nr:hypothetical protein [Dysgonomonas sp. ZJ279]